MTGIRRPLGLVLGAVFALVAVLGCRGFPDEFPAADFVLPDVFSKEKIRFSDYAGRPAILYWFTSW